MALFKYFKIEKCHSDLPLPDPFGPLNQQLSSTAIEKVNKYCVAHGLLYRHFSSWPLHINDLVDFLLPSHKEVALQLQVSNYLGTHDNRRQNCRF